MSDAPGSRALALRSVFSKLSGRFVQFVDLLAEVVEGGDEARRPDLLRLQELWEKTGSRRLERKLLEWGLMPRAADGVH